MRFPWTLSQWQQLIQRVTEKRLPHAMLFSGVEGLGKYDVAVDFARSLLCDRPLDNFMACGQCRSCIQFEAATHPDFLLLSPEEEGKQIKIDQIRDLIQQFQSG
jgi:DNA polymerase-3 subunit delta'